MEGALGKQQADALFNALGDSVEKIYTETSIYRADLSYDPSAATQASK